MNDTEDDCSIVSRPGRPDRAFSFRRLPAFFTAVLLLSTTSPAASAQVVSPALSQGTDSSAAPNQANSPTQGPPSPAAPPPTFTTIGPLSFSGSFTGDAVGVAAGGRSQALKLLTKTVLVAGYDGSSGPLQGWNAQISTQLVHGGHPSAANIGDVQGVDNIEAPNALRLYEAWISRQWHDGALGAKLGLTDLNVDFDTQQVAALFLNSSDGVGGEFGHSGLTGPSTYPAPALGLSGFWKPTDIWTLRAGVFDGVAGSPDHPSAFIAIRPPWEAGLLLVGQAERQWPTGVRAELGGWAYTSGLDALHRVDRAGNPEHLKRDRGFYGLVEGPIRVSERSSLAAWVRFGLADPVVQRISAYVGLGLVASGLIPSRQQDQAGIALNHVTLDDPSVPLEATSIKHAETAFELTYKTQLRDWLALQPDLQYVVHPNGDPRLSNALVITLRVSVALTHNLLSHEEPDQ